MPARSGCERQRRQCGPTAMWNWPRGLTCPTRRTIPTEFRACDRRAEHQRYAAGIGCAERCAEHRCEPGERRRERYDLRRGGPGPVQHRLDAGDEGWEGEEEQRGQTDGDELDRADVAVEPHRHQQPEPRTAPAVRASQAERAPCRPAVDEQRGGKHERTCRGDRQSIGAAFVGIARDRYSEPEPDRREQRQRNALRVAGMEYSRSVRKTRGGPGGHRRMLTRLRQLSMNYVDFHFFPRPK